MVLTYALLTTLLATEVCLVGDIMKDSPFVEEFYKVFHALDIADKGMPRVVKSGKRYIKFDGYYRCKRYVTFRFKTSRNLLFSIVEKKLDDLKYALGVDNLKAEWKDRRLYLTVRYKKTDIIKFRLIESISTMIPLGFDLDDEVIYWDITKDSHALVGGATNCGKSTLLRSIIFFLVASGQYHIMLADLKEGLEFNTLQHLKGVIEFADNIDDTMVLIKRYFDIAINRMKIIKDAGCKDFQAYDKKHPGEMKRMFLIIDEFAELIPRHKKKGDDDVIDVLINLARRCRAAGMHIILATQRPSADVIDGSLKANFTALIGLRTNNGVNSKIIIDETGLEDLDVGEAKAILCGKNNWFYTMLLEGKQLESMTNQYSVSPNDTIKEKEEIKEQLKLLPQESSLVDVDSLLESFSVK